jgi:4-amino-4-deoxy-L-arabinose transferase-like glycosyltransferase
MAWLLGFAAFYLALGIGLRDPWPSDEPRFALVAQEMLDTGRFWIPHRGGEAYPDKPPIYIWLTALSIWLAGSVRLGFLLPSLLAALGTLALVADLARRLYGARIAWVAVAALLASMQFVLQAKAAQIDMVLTFFTTLAAYGLLRHALLGPAPGWWLAAWAAVGAGIITKGVGFLPLLLLPCWLWLARRGQATPLRSRDVGFGLLVMVGVVALWGLPMILMSLGDAELAAYRDNILLRQTGQRYAAAWHHHNPWYYYLLEVIPWAWMPLSLALPWAIPAFYRRIRRGDAHMTLMLSGVLLILVFFSLSPGKRGVYVLPALPLLVLALAPLLPGLLRKRAPNLAAAGLLLLVGCAFVVAALGGLFGLPALTRIAERHQVAPWHWWLLLGMAALALLAWPGWRRGGIALTLWLAVFWMTWSTIGYGQLDRTRSPRELMQQVAASTGADAWLGMPNFDEEFLLQSRQPMVHFGRETPAAAQLAQAFHWLQQEPGKRWMLIEKNRQPDLVCAALDQARDIGYQNGDYWWLIPGGAFANCKGQDGAAPVFVVPTSLRPGQPQALSGAFQTQINR